MTFSSVLLLCPRSEPFAQHVCGSPTAVGERLSQVLSREPDRTCGILLRTAGLPRRGGRPRPGEDFSRDDIGVWRPSPGRSRGGGCQAVRYLEGRGMGSTGRQGTDAPGVHPPSGGVRGDAGALPGLQAARQDHEAEQAIVAVTRNVDHEPNSIVEWYFGAVLLKPPDWFRVRVHFLQEHHLALFG